MLSLEVMAILALGSFWLNVLLTVAMVWQRRTRLARRYHELSSLLISGEVIKGLGPDGTFANHCSRQLGWAQAAKGRVIDFEDDGMESTIHGGVIRTTSDEEIVVNSASRATWPDSVESLESLRPRYSCSSSEVSHSIFKKWAN